MSNRKKGIRIGHYRITPLGIGTLLALIVVIVGIIVVLGGRGSDRVVSTDRTLVEASPTTDPNASTPEPTATPVPATPTPEPTPSPTPEPRSATIRALGEISMETDLLKSVYDSSNVTFDFTPMFSLIGDVIGSADYTVADLEGTVGGTGTAGEAGRMLTPPSVLTALKGAGIDMLMLGNDHALDGGLTDLTSGIMNVDAAGLDRVGVYSSAQERSTPVIKEINGIKVAFVSYTDTINASTKDIPVDSLTFCVSSVANSNAKADIAAAKEAGADVIVVIMSWGKQYSSEATPEQEKTAEFLAGCGADVIIGYGPSVIQKIGWVKGSGNHQALCFYGTGNFLSSQRDSGKNCGLIAQFSISENADGSFTIEKPVYIPTYVIQFQNETGQNQYRTVAIGQWTDNTAGNLPEGMDYADLQYMGELWTQIQNFMRQSESIAEISRG